jgi:hypothetical protein
MLLVAAAVFALVAVALASTPIRNVRTPVAPVAPVEDTTRA